MIYAFLLSEIITRRGEICRSLRKFLSLKWKLELLLLRNFPFHFERISGSTLVVPFSGTEKYSSYAFSGIY